MKKFWSPMAPPDAFTLRRLSKNVEEFRQRTAQLPTQRDLEALGFSKETLAYATRKKVLVELYVTLTSGAIVKGYQVAAE